MANKCNKTFRALINDGEVKFLGITSIVPMGDWNGTTTYQKLNYVRHNGATYLAKTSSTNVEPGAATNWEDVWMLCNYDGGVSQVVSDGTYPDMTVGNANNANTATNAQQAINAQQAQQAVNAQQAQAVVGSYEQLSDGTYNLIIGLTGDAPSAAAITQINGEDLAGKEFYDYVRTIGAVLFSFNPDFSPAARYGGSWEKITDRFLVGAGGSYTLDSTGGSAMHTNTIAEMVSHDHGLPVVNDSGGFMPENSPMLKSFQVEARANNNQININGTATDWAPTGFSGPVGSTGDGQPFSILPPYIAVNIWRRVA